MTDTIGALRARILLQSSSRSADDIGGGAISWTDEAGVWAAIAASGAGEAAAFDATVSTASLVATINRRAVRAGWRVVWGARVLRIAGIRDDGGARIDLICEEEML